MLTERELDRGERGGCGGRQQSSLIDKSIEQCVFIIVNGNNSQLFVGVDERTEAERQ